MATDKPKRALNPKQELFCQLYATEVEFFGNGTQSYIEAYDPPKEGNWYNTARSRASELLTSPNVLARINDLLDLTLNDQHVDKQLAFLVTQNADLGSKVAAIREYNKLKQRITEKVEHSGSIATTTLTQDQIDAIIARRAPGIPPSRPPQPDGFQHPDEQGVPTELAPRGLGEEAGGSRERGDQTAHRDDAAPPRQEPTDNNQLPRVVPGPQPG